MQERLDWLVENGYFYKLEEDTYKNMARVWVLKSIGKDEDACNYNDYAEWILFVGTSEVDNREEVVKELDEFIEEEKVENEHAAEFNKKMNRKIKNCSPKQLQRFLDNLKKEMGSL